MKKHIALWSGGKDSTAGILLAHLNKEPLDMIVFAEVMYDNKREISGENPMHMRFVKEKAKPFFESLGYEVKIIRSEMDYLTFFHRTILRPTKHMEHKGMQFGFPLEKCCGIRRDCKIKPVERFLRNMKDDEVIEYLGICVDEPARLQSLHKMSNRVSLLEKYEITQTQARELCLAYDLLSPSYAYSKRGGCWFCPFAKRQEHEQIKRNEPLLWKEFMALENKQNLANPKWSVYGETLTERDRYI